MDNSVKAKKIIKVSSKTAVPQLAGSLIKCIEAHENVQLRAVGASAVNQMYKAIASARGTLAAKGTDIYIQPGFDEIDECGEKKTVMVANIVIG